MTGVGRNKITGLTAFRGHRRSILDILRNAHQHGPKSGRFEADKTWRRITDLARLYLVEDRVRRETVPVAQRAKRLRQLAKALREVRQMADKALQDDVGDDLYMAWFDENISTRRAYSRSVDHGDEFKKAVASLAALETAASKAADDVRVNRGRPKGTKLPQSYINDLKDVYAKSTGSKPDTGDGPCGQLVGKFLTAIEDGANATTKVSRPEKYLSETTKYRRKLARKNTVTPSKE